MSARDTILSRLASGSGARGDLIAGEAAALLRDMPLPPMPEGEAAHLFLEKLSEPSISATHDRIADLAALPEAVGRYLDGFALPRALYLPPDPALETLDWTGFDRHASAAPDETAALARALMGVAETGSLIFETAPHAPMLPNFLCLHHLVVLPRAAIVARLEAAAAYGLQPVRARYWVSGVSGTTDIEGQYVRGAHGPRYLHVIVTDEG
ncbi:LutC/YkgG family protein [Sphingobium aquiterrae]|uniref:LutC/YkgG family protein n=1 Tax=Sphingobium aquiterrae TaxID=2038656 RepID=UPI00301B0B81